MGEMDVLIHHFLEGSDQAQPNKTALINADATATYQEVNQAANQLARRLIAQGVTQGDRVVLIMENSIAYVIGYYAVLKAGAVVVPLSIALKAGMLKPLLHSVMPAAILASAKVDRLLQASIDAVPRKCIIVVKDRRKEWDNAPLRVWDWDDAVNGMQTANLGLPMDKAALASIIFTSGSSGMPKGVMLSHGNVVSNTVSICKFLAIRPDDVQMVVLPFHYVMGTSLLNTHVASGAQIVINNQFAFPAAVLKEMVERSVTAFAGVPSTYAYLLNRSPLADCGEALTALRYCSQAGGHMPRRIKQRLRQVLPAHTRIFIMYGATEAAARLTCLPPEAFERKMDSIGMPIEGVEISVVDADGCEVPTGQVGELAATGPNIMQGYWQDPDSTRMALDEQGRLRTGDLGYKDDEGFFYLIGRKDDMIKVGGHRIAPNEIEEALMDTGLVIETAVFGVPDEIQGQRIFALVVPKGGDAGDGVVQSLTKECGARLPRFKLPAEIKLVRSLPKNDHGKIDRRRCIQMVPG